MTSATPTSDRETEDKLIHRRLGRYFLIGKLAQGGMGSIYAARTQGIGGFERTFAVKVCHPSLSSSQEFVAMFLDEARLAAQIHHPNVVATIDVDRIDEVLFLVMEYIEGQSLKWLFKNCPERPPVPVVLRIMHDTLLGLHAAHELLDGDGRLLNLVHRDVSPQNIFVGVDGVCRILDFGVAKAEARYSSTRKGSIKGKMGYMSPEQISGGEIDRRSDVFAMGVVFWEALTKRYLFKGATPSETAGHVLYATIARPSETGGEVPTDVECVVMCALERDKDRRFATAKEMAEAVEKCGGSLASRAETSRWLRKLAAKEIARRQSLLRSWSQRATELDVEVVEGSTPRQRKVGLPLVILCVLVVAVVSIAMALSQRQQNDGSQHRTAFEPAGSEAPLVMSDAGASDGMGEPRPDVQVVDASADGELGDVTSEPQEEKLWRPRRHPRARPKTSLPYDPEAI